MPEVNSQDSGVPASATTASEQQPEANATAQQIEQQTAGSSSIVEKTNAPNEQQQPRGTKLPSSIASTLQEEPLPKYEDIAHLAPPKYSDLFQSNSSFASSFDFNEVELNGCAVGGYDVFFGFCILTVVFNLVGYLVSIFLCDSYAGRYGATFGFGLLIFASGILKFPLFNAESGQAPKQGNQLFANSVWVICVVAGALISTVSLSLYRKVRKDIVRYNEISNIP